MRHTYDKGFVAWSGAVAALWVIQNWVECDAPQIERAVQCAASNDGRQGIQGRGGASVVVLGGSSRPRLPLARFIQKVVEHGVAVTAGARQGNRLDDRTRGPRSTVPWEVVVPVEPPDVTASKPAAHVNNQAHQGEKKQDSMS